MRSSLIAWTIGGLLVLGVAVFALAQSQTLQPAAVNYRLVPVVQGLQNPWSVAFLPGGDMLVTERPGRLRIVRDGALLPAPVEGVPQVRAQGQGGLLEVALHPNFESNRLLYLSFSKPNEQGNQATTALVRARFENDRLTNVEEIFEAKAYSNGSNHFAGKIVFDAQGYLFLTVGDRGASPVQQGVSEPSLDFVSRHPAQDRTNHQGSVIRLHDDGRIPADNPFVGQDDVLPEIWSYGHRNPQGLTVHPSTGDVWAVEHGPQGGDELNWIRPGLNYGWPVIGYGVNYGAARNPIHLGAEREGMESPVHYWVPSIATSGLMVYTGNRFPEWQGNIFVGGLGGQQIARLTMNGRDVVSEETIVQGVGRVRDIRQGPDGYIYIAFDTPGTVQRLEPIS